jgi:hypothetical protein
MQLSAVWQSAWSGLALARRCRVIPVCRAMPFGVAEPLYALLVGLGLGFLAWHLVPVGAAGTLSCHAVPVGATGTYGRPGC